MKHLGFKAEGRTVPVCGLGVELRYISLVEMIREFDPTELAQLATHQEHAQITGEMLVAQIQGMPLDEWTDAQRVAVVAVVQKLCHACVRTGQMVEMALRQHPHYERSYGNDFSFAHIIDSHLEFASTQYFQRFSRQQVKS